MLAAALAAGPWPELSPATVLWRLPLAALAIVFSARRLGGKTLLVVPFVAAGLALDALVPAARDAGRVAAEASAQVGAVQRALGTLSEGDAVREVLAPTGGEAEPEAPFRFIDTAFRRFPARVDAAVLCDERGQPVAWVGERARLPLRMRVLGERAVSAEPGVDDVWVWWREPVFDAGKQVGALLAGVSINENGARRIFDVAVGRAAVVVPRLGGSVAVTTPGGSRVLGILVERAQAVLWSASGIAGAAVVLLLSVWSTRPARFVFVAGAFLWLEAGGLLGRVWWLPAAVLAGAWFLEATRARPWAWVAGMGMLGGFGWGLGSMIEEIGREVIPDHLLAPTPFPLALVVTTSFLVRSTVRAPWRLPVPVRVVAWVPLVLGVARADVVLLGVGAAMVVAFGLPVRTLALGAVVAACLLAGGDDAAHRRELVGRTEATLARIQQASERARALLASFPEAGFADLTRLSAWERTTVLGKLASWTRLAELVPGSSLELIDPTGEAVSTWGHAAVPGGPREEGLASRALRGNWRVAVTSPSPPRDVLEALIADGIKAPLAAYARSGAPLERGAIFRPLSPARVGRALAEGTGWYDVGVGEREFATYLRAYRDWVLAVPWVRPPNAEVALVLAGLALWGAFPLVAWEQRRTIVRWWGERRTFAGRIRLLTAAATVVPVLLLGQLLPRQWMRERAQARLELGRSLSRTVGAVDWAKDSARVQAETAGAIAVYRSGSLATCSRPDYAVLGRIPLMCPSDAYIRAVRGWREPLIAGEDALHVFAPVQGGQEPVVVAFWGVQGAPSGGAPSPREWFVITALLGLTLALVITEQLGRRLAQPMRRLGDAARRLERGEPVAELETTGDEDVAALGRAFVAMANTVQKREEELRRERDLLEGVLRTLSAAVVVTDATGRVELANPAARPLLGEGVGVANLERELGPGAVTLLDRAAAGDNVTETLRPANAPERLWRVTALPLAGAAGRRLLVMEDLSEVARAERLASIAELARIVAHEIKNPLTPIRLWAEELRVAVDRGEEALPEIARVAAEQIMERTAHLREVAQGFSHLVALEHWDAQPVELAALARDVVAEYGVLAQRGVAVRVAARGDCRVAADPQWLRRALRHLLENSVRAIGSRAGAIDVTTTGDAGTVTLVVRDTGGGVAEEHLGRLFEPHFSTTSEGTGLGLAVVRRVADRAGGRVEATNVDGGLEVRISLPAAPAG